MSIAELWWASPPSSFLPCGRRNHQTKNARSLSDRDEAILLPDSEVVDGLEATIVGLLEDSDRQNPCKPTSSTPHVQKQPTTLSANWKTPMIGTSHAFFIGIGGIGMTPLHATSMPRGWQ